MSPNARRLSVPEAWREIGRGFEGTLEGNTFVALFPFGLKCAVDAVLAPHGGWGEIIASADDPGACALAAYWLALEAEEETHG